MMHLSGCLSVWFNFVTIYKKHQILLWYTENRCAPIHTRHCFLHNGPKEKRDCFGVDRLEFKCICVCEKKESMRVGFDHNLSKLLSLILEGGCCHDFQCSILHTLPLFPLFTVFFIYFYLSCILSRVHIRPFYPLLFLYPSL